MPVFLFIPLVHLNGSPKIKNPQKSFISGEILEQVMGIEPTRPAWKAGVLPLNYTCIFLPPVSSRNYYITFNYICQQKIVLLPIYGNVFAVCPGVYRFYTSLFHNDFSNAVFHFFSDNTADITGTKLATLCLFHYK